jgi:hypothetical protein
MNGDLSRHELVSLLAGETTAEQLAQHHGVQVADVERSKRAFVEGLKAGSESKVPRRFGARALIAAALVVASAAFAQLTVFQPDTPAQASTVNANFSQLRTWIENKVGSTASNDVSIAAANKVSFGSTTRQMIDLYATGYGIGVQASTAYYRSDSTFAWFRGGTHSNTQFDPGAGGSVVMRLYDGPPRLAVGNRWMLGGHEQQLTMVRGTYNPSNSATTGGGYSVTRVGGGVFDITFSRPFSDSPTILCSPNHPNAGPQTGGVVHCTVAHPQDVTGSTFRVFIVDGQNGARDWPFSFIAVGSAPSSPSTPP